MRIAFISTILDYPWGGADVLWTRTAAAALRAGHDVLVAVAPVVAGHPRIAALQAAGAVLHTRDGFTQQLGRRARWRQALQHLGGSPRSLTAALDAFRPEVVIISQGGVFDLLIEDGLNRWLAATACPFVLICQSNDERDRLAPADQILARRILPRARKIIFVSTHNRDHAVRQCGAALDQAVVVGNPVELPAGQLPLPWPDLAAPRLAVVARLETEPKGFDVLLAALALIPAAGGWQVDVFGRGPDEAALRARAAELGLGPRLNFCGYETDVSRVWTGHQGLVLSSRREGCALAMLEAMACGRPVFTTEVGGARDWIEPGVNGAICPPGDAGALAGIIQQALATCRRWPEMGSASARIIQQRLDPAPESAVLAAAGVTPR
jgi:glycosyltransferase involved in cell wall biosynthesis